MRHWNCTSVLSHELRLLRSCMPMHTWVQELFPAGQFEETTVGIVLLDRQDLQGKDQMCLHTELWRLKCSIESRQICW